MILTFWKYYVYVHHPFNKVVRFLGKEKYTSHTIAHLMLFTQAFCYMCVENLPIGPPGN